jgi:hypothetical protein
MKTIDDLIALEPKNTTVTLSAHYWELLLKELAFVMQFKNRSRENSGILFEEISSQLYEKNIILKDPIKE